MKIRRAVPADVLDIVRCVRAAYRDYVPLMDREPAPMTQDYEVLVARGEVRVALRTGDREIVGVLVSRLAEDHVFVDNVAVRPDAQRLGVGRELLAVVDDDAAEADLASVRLYTNEVMAGNLAMYPRLGFEETHRSAESGFNRVYFDKRIGRPSPD